jgi:CBS domain containing-hemolysin-like protein
VGDINDEFDEDEIYYSRLDNENFVFDGKTSITDVGRVMNLDDETFDKIRGDAETIGGLMIELAGRIPTTGQTIKYGNFAFTAELSDKRRVRRVKVSKLPAPAQAAE